MALSRRSPLSRFKVVVLPDFFLDAIVALPAWAEARPMMEAIVENGGGNLPVGPVEFKVGGNAANLAVALARLGVKTELVTETNALGRFLLERARKVSGVGLRHVRVGEATSATLALEFGGANLMLSHAGPLFDYGPEKISPSAWRALESADGVVVNNWAQNRSGTKLLKTLVPRVHRKGVRVFLDTADPRHRGLDFGQLLSEKSIWKNLDAWGLNENEVRAACQDRGDDTQSLATELAERLRCRLDVHTRTWAATIHDGHAARVEAYGSKPRRLTGAGDAWNAGNLAGYLLELPPRERLKMAHTVATKYVTGASGLPPTAADLSFGARKT